jgi:hypothetical protein
MSGTFGLPSEPHLKFTYLVVGQMLVLVAMLASLDSLTTDYFVVISFMLILVTAEYTAPLAVTLEWRSRLRWVLLCWSLVFGFIAYRRIMSLWVS